MICENHWRSPDFAPRSYPASDFIMGTRTQLPGAQFPVEGFSPPPPGIAFSVGPEAFRVPRRYPELNSGERPGTVGGRVALGPGPLHRRYPADNRQKR